jgi:hypothetical protein
MIMKKTILISAICALLSGGVVAFATQTNYLGTVFIADTTTPANQLKVNADGSINVGGGGGSASPISVSSFDSGPIKATCTGTPCVTNSSHAAGTSVGGLFTLPLARVAGGSGILTGEQFISLGGSTGGYVLRGWTKQPASTCTDNTAYANNAADDANLIIGTPITITPSAPGVTTGDARTYAPLTGLTWDYKNNDGTPSQNLYFCVVTIATDTADDNTTPELIAAGPQN